MSAKGSLFSGLLSGAKRALGAKEVVGTDALGNTYVRWFERANGVQTERREVKWSKPHVYYDPKDIPSEWRMWLRKLRDDPPSQQELQESASKAAAYRQRVAQVEEQERLRRVRQATQATQATQPGSQGPDLSRMINQMQQDDGGQGTGGGSSEPSGTGDAFKPGTWKPGQ